MVAVAGSGRPSLCLDRGVGRIANDRRSGGHRTKSKHHAASAGAEQERAGTGAEWAMEVLAAVEGQGGDVSKVEPQDFGERGTGLVAKQAMEAGEEAMSVPEKLCYTSDAAERVFPDAMGRIKGSQVKDWQRLALCLMLAKDSPGDSLFEQYARSLPEETDSPLFWSEEERGFLAGSQALETARGYEGFLAREHERLVDEVFRGNESAFDTNASCSFQRFKWAFCILRSRALSPFDGSTETIGLLPGMDLFNHASKVNNTWEKASVGFLGRKQVVRLPTGESVGPGQEVRMNYGAARKGDKDMLIDFGFVDADAQSPSYALSLEIPSEDAFLDDKEDILDVCGLDAKPQFQVTPGDPVPEGLLEVLRLVHLGGSDAFLLEPIFRENIWAILNNPISEENEQAVCEFMIESCDNALRGYAKDFQEEKRLLEEGHLDGRPRERAASLVAIGEKRCLLSLLDDFRNRFNSLPALEYYQERRLRQLGLLDEEGQRVPIDPFREMAGE